MCFAVFLYQAVPNVSFVLCFNRDEILNRPTKPAHFWEDAPHILGGRDEVRGGTWLGVNKSNGRFAFLTNYREAEGTYSTTRGDLTTNFLKGTDSPAQYLKHLDGSQYAGFNLIVGNATVPEFWYMTNRGAHTTPRQLHPGVYGMSNGTLDDAWPKMQHGQQLATTLINNGTFTPSHTSPNTFPWDDLFTILSDDQPLAVGSDGMPDRGRGVAFEHAANCIFMKPFALQNGMYFGTRSQIVLAAFAREGGQHGPWHVELRERAMLGDAVQIGEHDGRQGVSKQPWSSVVHSFDVAANGVAT